MEWLRVGGGIASTILPLLAFMSLLNSPLGIVETVVAEIAFFLFSVSLFSFSSIFLDREGKKTAEVVFIASATLSIAAGALLFPLAAIFIASIALFIYSFLRARDDYLFQISLAFAISTPILYASIERHSLVWVAYWAAFYLLSLSALLRLSIMKSLSSSMVTNVATKHGVLRVKMDAMALSIAFSILALLVSASSTHVAPVVAVSIALSSISWFVRSRASFYITLASIILFASTMVVL